MKEKILSNFEGKVVRKDLTSKVKGNAVVPSYVLEYLLGQYCAVDDEDIIANGIEKVKEIIRNNFVQKSDAETVKSSIREKGSYKIIDKVKVVLNDKDDYYESSFENLSVSKVHVPDNIVKNHPKLLSGEGVWCIVSIGYDHSDGAKTRWLIETLKPIQVSGVDLDDYREKRQSFTTDEWLDLLVQSIGLNPEYFNRRGKLIQISRLITHVENNYNYVELGPKGTGKSHIFSELSPHGVLVSGGDVTSARLFVSNTGKGKVGLVGYWDVVCLDEFEQVVGSKRSDGDMVNIMQNYMANKSFNRGKESVQAYASMAFIGNTKHSVPYMLKNSHLFESIPQAYIKGAFLDRIHIYIPGWEVKILKNIGLSSDYGFIVDYLAEILRQLRKFDYSNYLDNYVSLDPTYSGRDTTSVRKTFSGLVKLIYPHLKMTEEEALELVYFANEGRKRVKDQLYIFDETFRNEPVNFRYKVKSNQKTIEVETLENMSFGVKPVNEPVQDNPDSEIVPVDSKIGTPVNLLVEKNIVIHDNQTGVSYKKLFGDYLVGASRVEIVDPYIRMPYQAKKLIEFCQVLADVKTPESDVALHVITWNKDECIPDVIDWFLEIQDSIAPLGINFTWAFEDYHDRHILTDTGWKIKLGRGLDLFEKVEGFFNTANVVQELRLCKNCEITYLRI
jgi:ATP-dependent Lon protease